MEFVEYYIDLIDVFFVIEKMEYLTDRSVDDLEIKLDDVDFRMQLFRDVYPQVYKEWSNLNFFAELRAIKKTPIDNTVGRKVMFGLVKLSVHKALTIILNADIKY